MKNFKLIVLVLITSALSIGCNSKPENKEHTILKKKHTFSHFEMREHNDTGFVCPGGTNTSCSATIMDVSEVYGDSTFVLKVSCTAYYEDIDKTEDMGVMICIGLKWSSIDSQNNYIWEVFATPDTEMVNLQYMSNSKITSELYLAQLCNGTSGSIDMKSFEEGEIQHVSMYMDNTTK